MFKLCEQNGKILLDWQNTILISDGVEVNANTKLFDLDNSVMHLNTFTTFKNCFYTATGTSDTFKKRVGELFRLFKFLFVKRS